MVTRVELGVLAAAHGIELRPDLEVVVIPGESLGAFIDLVATHQLVILGLDGFKLDGSVVVPLMDYIADFGEIAGSWASRVHASAGAAREVVGQWGPMPDLIEVTLDGVDG